MSLKEQAARYIKKLGVDRAAEKFGKKASTIKRWIATDTYPIEVAEAAMENDMDFVMPEPRQEAMEAISDDAGFASPTQPIYDGPEKPQLQQFDPIQLLEEHRSAMVMFAQRLTDIESFLTRVSAPPPPPPAAREPQVVTGMPKDEGNIRPVFNTRANLGGNVAPVNSPPPTTPDAFGMTMKALLTPYDYSKRR